MHSAQPLPVSQASKKARAVSVMDSVVADMVWRPFILLTSRGRWSGGSFCRFSRAIVAGGQDPGRSAGADLGPRTGEHDSAASLAGGPPSPRPETVVGHPVRGAPE